MSNVILVTSKTGHFCCAIIMTLELGIETSGSSLSEYLQTLSKYSTNIFVPKCGPFELYVCERTLHNDSFAKFTKATLIYVKDIGLTTIEPNAFRGPKRLKQIWIENNKSLAGLRLKYAMFKGLDHLEHLKIAFSNIPSVENGTFVYLKLLDYLDLSYNKIHYISKGIFTGLTKLIWLKLEYNRISVIEDDGFIDLIGLVILNLQENQICQVNESTFRGLENLVWLHIHNNNISEVMPKAFNSLIKLETLNMYDNFVSKISVLTF